MNVDELLLTVHVATAGWLSDQNAGMQVLKAREVQAELLNFVKAYRGQGGRRLGERLKRALIREVNRFSMGLIIESRDALRSLERGGACFTVEGARYPEETESPLFPFDSVPYLVAAREFLDWCCELRLCPAAKQPAMGRYAWASAEAAVLRSRVDDPEVSIPERARIRAELLAAEKLAKHERATWQNGPLLPGASLAPLINPLMVPVELPLGADPSLLIEVAGWFEELGSRHYLPGPLERRGDSETMTLIGLTERYEAAGWAFTILGAWTRALALGESSRRCDLCYRHLGRGMRKFCRCHLRTGLKRQPARELHVSALHHRDMKQSAQSALPVVKELLRTQDDSIGATTSRPHAVALRLPGELVEPASVLAAMLRSLYPVSHPRVRDDLAAHFQALLQRTRAAFELTAHDLATAHLIRVGRHRAVTALNWPTFFRTWFGDDSVGGELGLAIRGRMWDLDHPALTAGLERPAKIAQDLARLSSWLHAEDSIDRLAYIDLREVVELRRAKDPSSGRQLSCAEIGRRIGASAEAVRKTLLYASTSGVTPARRERLLPQRRHILNVLSREEGSVPAGT